MLELRGGAGGRGRRERRASFGKLAADGLGFEAASATLLAKQPPPSTAPTAASQRTGRHTRLPAAMGESDRLCAAASGQRHALRYGGRHRAAGPGESALSAID